MDEMERHIALKSMRISYLFTLIALAVWGIADILSGRGMVIQLYLLIAQNLVHFICTQIFRKQVGDDGWKQSVTDIAVTVLIIIAVALIIPIFFAVRIS